VFTLDPELLTWLLDTDPALRWQVERDLDHAPIQTWQATRARVPREGMGAALIAHQGADGQWAGGAYFPSGHPTASEQTDRGQPWTATTWSLTQLREWGVRASDLSETDTADLLEENARWEYEDRPYWDGEVDCCINAMTVANGIWLGRDMRALAHWFPEHQLADGGWNCAWVQGATVSSVHSTLNSIKGLLRYERAVLEGVAAPDPDLQAIRESRYRGEEYLLQRELLYRLRDGDLIGAWVTDSTYPFRWQYSALNALTYFRDAGVQDGTPPDPRLGPAVGMLSAQQQADGRFLQGHVLPGAVWFPVDVPDGEPSPWVTFLALRVLQWWDGR
jgi:hypothetical protein